MKVYILVNCTIDGNTAQAFKSDAKRREYLESYLLEIGHELTDEEYLTSFVELEDDAWLDIYDCDLK